MTYAADLHLHSPYALATSKELTFENLARWAKIKGIDLLASADFTHPVWFQETKRKLRDDGDGLYELDGVRFVLGTEVNCNAPVGSRNRRVHVLLFVPSIETAERVNAALAAFGKLGSDGRPTLHVSPRDLLALLLDLDERCLMIPAHAWTPWFGVYGSKSGFDSLEECFGDLADHVYAIETGLSSDPAMNWRIAELAERSIVSFSDAHSPPKMGRELTVFDGPLSYDGLVASLKDQRIAYTVEFFPEEGKYHHSGHRKCGIRRSPEDILRQGDRCPRCGRRMTLGVLQRLEELADAPIKTWTDEHGFTRSDNGRPPFRSLVSLRQIIAEATGVGVNTKRVQGVYFGLTEALGGELAVLTRASPSDVSRVAGERVAEGVDIVRRGDVAIEPGYDGVYGTVRVWPS